ncbi:MAG: hypothetical protein RR998_08420 [Oscillospiraceae bacterium]
MTNFEKIKQSGKEEMAEIILQDDFCASCEFADDAGICRYSEKNETQPLYKGCSKACEKWLDEQAVEI